MIGIGSIRMSTNRLNPEQQDAVSKLKNGSILYGSVGSGKSLTSLAYYVRLCGGVEFDPKPFPKPMDLYIITPASKRDKCEWDKEIIWLFLHAQTEIKIKIDSWNNISKYKNVQGAFFIFDEQRLVGSGAWVKSFLKIAKKNKFILLTATPGDNWMDYIPIFLANGFYESRYEFIQEHVVYNPYLKFPKVVRYNNEGKLMYLKRSILVKLLRFEDGKVRHWENILVPHDSNLWNRVYKDRWNPWKNKPVKDATELVYLMRRVANSFETRLEFLWYLHREKHPRIILFYNFDYELELIKKNIGGIPHAEYNGHKHEPIPDTESWIYLVQYIAGAEGWNCTKTNAVVFWSPTYSYKTMIQAAGRVDRLNSPYDHFYYYRLFTDLLIDKSINEALEKKKNFNEKEFRKKHGI